MNPNLLPVVGRLASGEPVIERFNLHKHSGVSPYWLRKAFALTHSNERPFFVETVEFDRDIGNCICVGTSDQDAIVFAKRPKRPELTRFVLGRLPEPARFLTVILKAADSQLHPEHAGMYVLVTSFIGGKAEPEPWDGRAISLDGANDALERSLQFWSNHALVLGAELVECFHCGCHLRDEAVPVHQVLLCETCLRYLCDVHRRANPNLRLSMSSIPHCKMLVPGWEEIVVPQLP
jgi:hypothetical protein